MRAVSHFVMLTVNSTIQKKPWDWLRNQLRSRRFCKLADGGVTWFGGSEFRLQAARRRVNAERQRGMISNDVVVR
jgi:hypothetical protein